MNHFKSDHDEYGGSESRIIRKEQKVLEKVYMHCLLSSHTSINILSPILVVTRIRLQAGCMLKTVACKESIISTYKGPQRLMDAKHVWYRLVDREKKASQGTKSEGVTVYEQATPLSVQNRAG